MTEKEKEIYENIEKILMNKIDNKNKKEKNSQAKNNNNNINTTGNKDLSTILKSGDFTNETINFKKSYKEDNPIKSHFEKIIDSENIEKINCFKSSKAGNFKHSVKLYNQKIGEYSYNLFDNEINNKKNKTEVAKKYNTSK